MTHLVWDMDGTLLDTTSVVPDAFVATVQELGVADVDREKVVAAYSLGVPEVMLGSRPPSDSRAALGTTSRSTSS